jgi:hypothetical protein
MNKSKGYSLTYLLYLASFSKMKQVAKSGRKVKAINLTFLLFLASFSKMK